MKCFSYLTLLSQRMGGGLDRLFTAQLFAPRIPPGRTLGCYLRLCGLLMTTEYVIFKVPKNNPFTFRSREGVTSTDFPEVFLRNFSHAKHSAKHLLPASHFVWRTLRRKWESPKDKVQIATLAVAV